MFSRFPAIKIDMKIKEKLDPETEGVFWWLFEVFGSILGGFWEAKCRKKALRNQAKNGCVLGGYLGFKSGGPAGRAEWPEARIWQNWGRHLRPNSEHAANLPKGRGRRIQSLRAFRRAWISGIADWRIKDFCDWLVWWVWWVWLFRIRILIGIWIWIGIRILIGIGMRRIDWLIDW